jgi:hypothetical protein
MISVFGMDKVDWDNLLFSIRKAHCTPLLGPGMASGLLPLAGDIARELATAYQYPLANTRDLAGVAEYVATMYGDGLLRSKLIQRLREASPYSGDRNTPYDVLAGLPLPLYLMTGFGDFMEQALERRDKKARQEVSRWHKLREWRRWRDDLDSASDFEPTPESPLVFHLYGHMKEPESIVITESDYLGYVATAGVERDIFPLYMKAALSHSTLLILGESIHSWSFRAFYRIVSRYLNRSVSNFAHVMVVSPSDFDSAAEERRDEARAYTERYLAQSNVRLYVGSVSEFVAELGRRAEDMGIVDKA